MSKLVNLRYSSYIFRNSQPGDVWLVGFKGKSNYYTFIYADKNNNLCYIETNSRFYNLYYSDSSKCIKLKIKFEDLNKQIIDKKLNKELRLSYQVYSFGKESDILVIDGEEPKLFDFVVATEETSSRFESNFGLLIGKDKCLFPDGSQKKIHICRKCSDEELQNAEHQCNILKSLYKLISGRELNKNIDREYKVGDIYKKGDSVYLYLGNRRIISLYNNNAKISVVFELPKEYNTGGDLWFKFKLSEDIILRDLILELNNGQVRDLGEMNLYMLLLRNMKGLKLNVNSIKSYDCFKYNVRSSMLGGYIGHIKEIEKVLENNHEYRFRTYNYSDYIKVIKRNLKIYIQ